MPRTNTFEWMVKKKENYIYDTCLSKGFSLKPENGEWKTKGKRMGRKLLVDHTAVTE